MGPDKITKLLSPHHNIIEVSAALTDISGLGYDGRTYDHHQAAHLLVLGEITTFLHLASVLGDRGWSAKDYPILPPIW